MDERIYLAEIDYLSKHKPEIIFMTSRMVYFREVEDMIAYVVDSFLIKRVYKIVRGCAYRYCCLEDGGKRYYYLIEASKDINSPYVKLVAGDATDYSGHGLHDKNLIEFFITKFLRLQLIDRPLSYLVSDLLEELYHLTRVK